MDFTIMLRWTLYFYHWCRTCSSIKTGLYWKSLSSSGIKACTVYTHSVRAQDRRGGGSISSSSNAFCFLNEDTQSQATSTLLVYSACENWDYLLVQTATPETIHLNDLMTVWMAKHEDPQPFKWRLLSSTRAGSSLQHTGPVVMLVST